MACSNLSTGARPALPGLREDIMTAKHATINVYVGMALSKNAWRRTGGKRSKEKGPK